MGKDKSNILDNIMRLNQMKIADYACSIGEVDFILVENNEENTNVLKSLGATTDEISNMIVGMEAKELDITSFSFGLEEVDYWCHDEGFGSYEKSMRYDL